MQTAPSRQVTDWSREGPRTLIAKDGAVWIWPGIPLAMEQDGAIQPLPRRWVRSRIRALHGFEAQDARLEPALMCASAYLTAGDEGKAQQALDLAKIDRLSPEGKVLMWAVAEELGIAPLEMAVGTRSLPWGIGNLGVQIARFRRFGGAARAFEKADNPDQPRWPKGAPQKPRRMARKARRRGSDPRCRGSGRNHSTGCLAIPISPLSRCLYSAPTKSPGPAGCGQ